MMNKIDNLKYKNINVRKIVRDLGGPTFVAERHKELSSLFGFKFLSINTIHSWIRRNKIQWGRLIELYEIANSFNFELDIRDYIESEGKKNDTEIN